MGRSVVIQLTEGRIFFIFLKKKLKIFFGRCFTRLDFTIKDYSFTSVFTYGKSINQMKYLSTGKLLENCNLNSLN